MIYSTKGILLHRLKYSDTKLILKIFTEEFGLQSYLFFVSKSAKNKSKLNLLQPMYILDLQVYHKELPGLQKIKEVAAAEIFKTIPFNIYKQSVSLFLAEFLLKILQENEKDTKLFNFIFKSVKNFDIENTDRNNFHLYFLCELTEYLGIHPENNYSDSRKIFDTEKAKFIVGHPSHRNFFNETISFKFSEILSEKNNKNQIVELSNNQRRELLQGIINFYNFHLERPGKIKSLEILAQVFS